MSYPLSNLSFSIRSRLSSLATPSERYLIQIATGDVSICPPMVRLAKKDSTIAKNLENKSAVVESSIHSNVSLCNNYLVIRHVDAEDLVPRSFDYFALRPDCLQLLECTLSKSFMNNLLSMTIDSVNVLTIHNCSLLANFTDVLDAFPSLKKVEVAYSMTKEWATEMLSLEYGQLYELKLIIYAEEIQHFDVDDLVSFLRVQTRGFRVYIYIINKDRPTFSKHVLEFKKALSQQLPGKAGNKRMSLTHLVISFDFKLHTWCLPDSIV